METLGRNKKRGPAPFKPSQRMRNMVEIAAAASMSHVQIASVLHVSRQTLENNFDDELKNGRARKLLQTLCLLDKQAKRGSTAAAKFLCNVFHNGAPGQRLSKKEQRARDAAEALHNSPWGDILKPAITNGQDDEHDRI